MDRTPLANRAARARALMTTFGIPGGSRLHLVESGTGQRRRAAKASCFAAFFAVAALLMVPAPLLADTGTRAASLNTKTAPKLHFVDSKSAFLQGRGAYLSQNYELAIPALEFAVEKGVIVSNYYLARIYSDNNGPYTDHGRAFRHYRQFVDRQGEVDPGDIRIAPYIARAWKSLGMYARDGIPAIELKPNLAKAIEYFEFAAQEYGNEDAQFELAKLHLTGDGVAQAVPHALHWLAALSRRGHASAQAFLADLFWRGHYTRKDPERAMALVTVALRNASADERIWIEDLHHKIYCGVEARTRQTASGLVADWRSMYGKRTARTDGTGNLRGLEAGPVRRCRDGEVVRELRGQSEGDRLAEKLKSAAQPTTAESTPSSASQPETTTSNTVEQPKQSAFRTFQFDKFVLQSGAGRSGPLAIVGTRPALGKTEQ
jgi:uncharacterized protein